jgi:uncharacterized membrane protein
MIILSILKLNNLNLTEIILFTIGLSLSFLMILGFFMNHFYPLIGLSNPISEAPLAIIMTIIVTFLLFFAYYLHSRSPNEQNPTDLKSFSKISLSQLLLLLFPFLSIFGTYLVNFYNQNFLLIILIIAISVVPIFVEFDRIKREFYPVAIFIIAVSILYHRSLISMYLWGWDIHQEYYFSNLVYLKSYWNPATYSTLNSMLSIVMLAPIYSIICNVEITWVFKIIYPFLFALVPLGLYTVFRKQTSEKIAFFSCFFFMSIFTFYSEMLSLARQEIAELFLVLLIMLIIDREMSYVKKSILSVIFAFSLVVSHYGLSYIFMFSLLFVWFIIILNPLSEKIATIIFPQQGLFYKAQTELEYLRNNLFSLRYVALYFTLALTWYINISSSAAFNAIIYVWKNIRENIYELFNPEVAQGMALLIKAPTTPLRNIQKILHIIAIIFIIIGIIKSLLRKNNRKKFNREYLGFTLYSLILSINSFILPLFASSINTTRLYHITLFFLSPFFVLGWTSFFTIFEKRISWVRNKFPWKMISIFLLIFLLFDTGFIYEIANDYPTSISISRNSVRESNDIRLKASFHDAYNTFEEDIYGVNWLSKNAEENIVYSDYLSQSPLFSYGMIKYQRYRALSIDTTIDKNNFIYLGYANIVDGVIYIKSTKTAYNTTILDTLLEKMDKLYSNGGSEIYGKF